MSDSSNVVDLNQQLDTENKVLSLLSESVANFKSIAEIDPVLGDILLGFTRQSMDLFEALVKDEFFPVNNTIDFIAQTQGLSTNDVLSKSYPQSCNTVPDANEDLTDFIMKSSSVYEENAESYKATVSDLLSDFKANSNKVLNSKVDTAKHLPGSRLGDPQGDSNA